MYDCIEILLSHAHLPVHACTTIYCIISHIARCSILTGVWITVVNVLITIDARPTSFTGTGVGRYVILVTMKDKKIINYAETESIFVDTFLYFVV